jgi:hypothetical protein
MKVAVTRTGTYVPEWNGNRDLPEKEQVVVHFHFLSFEEQEQLVQVGKDNKATTNFAAELRKRIDAIDNLTVDAGGEERAIESGADLVSEPAAERLAFEVWRHLTSLDPISANG